MEKLEQTLRDWRQSPQQMIEIDRIKTDPALQPRNDKLVPYKDQYRVAKESADHVARLHVALEGGRDVHLDPLLIASIDDVLYVVDGHHRLKAYKRAGRGRIAARVMQVTRTMAVLVSKLVNASGTKLPLTPEQAREACWQFIAAATARGTKDPGIAYRAIGGPFGVKKDTVGKMLRRVTEVKVSDFHSSACDEGTGWPQWKYVRLANYTAQVEISDPDQRRQWQAEKDAAKLAALREKFGHERFTAAVAMLLRETSDAEEADGMKALRKWSAMEEQVVY